MQQEHIMHPKARLCSAGMFAALVMAWAPATFAGKSTKVTAVGQAAVYGGDKAHARDRAIEDAQRKAVEQAVGSMVSSETITQNFQLISDKIFSKSKGYVKKYKIVSESEDSGAYVVKIEAQVSSGALQGDLDGVLAVLRAKNMPRVIIMVTEQNVGSSKTAEWWTSEEGFSIDLGIVENSLIDDWTNKGFTFVERQSLSGNSEVKDALGKTGAGNVKTLASRSGAEVLITGKAIATDSGSIMGSKMRSISGNVSLRVENLDTGEVLGTASFTNTAGHINSVEGGRRALKGATKKCADDLLKKIIAKWEGHVAGPQTIKLTIRGVKKTKYLRAIRKHLSSVVRGVQNVRQRSFSKKIARLEVDIKGSASHLAEELEEKTFPGFNLEVDEITANAVSISLK